MIDHWWQTETGWPIVANPVGIELLPVKPGSPTVPLPGWDVQVLDSTGRAMWKPGTDGAIVVKLPDAARLAPDAVERRRAFHRLVHVRRSPATTSPATAAGSTPTATSTSWAAPTT